MIAGYTKHPESLLPLLPSGPGGVRNFSVIQDPAIKSNFCLCLYKWWRRERDSNPRYTFRCTHDFQSCTFGQLGHLSIIFIHRALLCMKSSSLFEKMLNQLSAFLLQNS